MRITEKYLIELGKTLTKRFPTLHLGTRSTGWHIYRSGPGKGSLVTVSGQLETNREALEWMDGFHAGANEREQEIRTAIGKAFHDWGDGGDTSQLLAILTTWMPT